MNEKRSFEVGEKHDTLYCISLQEQELGEDKKD